jgi:hypothetical protein
MSKELSLAATQSTFSFLTSQWITKHVTFLMVYEI